MMLKRDERALKTRIWNNINREWISKQIRKKREDKSKVKLLTK